MSAVLFVRGGALGDFVLTLPVLAALIEAGHTVDVACDRRWAPLLRFVGPVRRVWDVHGAEVLWMHGGRDPVGYGFAVAFSSIDLPIADVRRVAARPPPGVSAAEHFASVYPCDPGWRLPVPPIRADRPIVVAPGSAGPAKVWPRWAEVIARLPEAVVVGGPNEPWATYRPDLLELAGLLASARVVLASDSGPAHLAARVGTPVGIVFGPTDPRTWAPRGATPFPWEVESDKVVAWTRGIAG